MIHIPQFINQGSAAHGGGGGTPGTIQLGTVGTLQSSSLGLAPFTFAWDYGFASWIIEGSELSAITNGQTIDSIELYFGAQSSSSFTMNTQRIYIGNVSVNTWSGNVPQVDHSSSSTVTGRSQVKYSFNQTFQSSQTGTWLTFTFDAPFTYNGTSNICIDWENRDGSYAFGGPKFHIETKTNMVAYKRQDYSYPSGNCYLDDERPIMKINYS